MKTISSRVQASMETPAGSEGRLLQRKCACGRHGVGGGECDSCRKKRLLQRSPRALATKATSRTAPPEVSQVLRTSGAPLDARTRETMESRFGHQFADVRIHTGSQADLSAQAVGAVAYAVGRDIVFTLDAYRPDTASGTRLLAHELAHVVQQRGMNGIGDIRVAGSESAGLEREADSAAESVIRGASPTVSGSASPGVFRFVVDEEAGGCGVCKSGTEVGREVHEIVGEMFHMAYLSVRTEIPIFNPTDSDNGRLDLLRIVKDPAPPYETYIEIGEIKPNNVEGIKDGAAQLLQYQALVAAAQEMFPELNASVHVEMMELPPPPSTPLSVYQDSTAPDCPQQLVDVSFGGSGLYLYSCIHPRSALPKDCCNDKDKVKVPVPVTSKEKDPAYKRLVEFIRRLVETGEEIEDAVRAFLQANPDLVNYVIAFAVGGLIAMVAEDIATLGTNIMKDPLIIAICATLIRVAEEVSESLPAAP